MSLAGFIVTQRVQHRVPYATSCQALGVTRGWFYKWRHGDPSTRRARREALAAAVRYLFTKHKRRYGSPRITADLREMGWQVSVNTVAALMREQHLVARPKRRRRGGTKRDRSARKAPDLLNRDFSSHKRPNVAWVGDLTDLPCREGSFWLASVLDLHSRRVVGFAMGAHHDAALARAALCMAVAVRGGDVSGVIFHTDQGGEYTGLLFAQACLSAGVTQSMGRTGSALDNAVSEAFHSTLEFELLAEHAPFASRAQARRAVADYLQWYNHERRHSTAAMMAPGAYEQAARARRQQAA